MSIAAFHSFLAKPLSDFVAYKRALNRKYRTEAAALRLFDRYLCEHSVAGWDSIDGIFIDGFLQSRPRGRARSYNHLLGVLHRFFEWTIVQGLSPRNPVIAKRRRDTGKRIPYLFDLQDAKSLLQVARTLPDRSRAPNRALVYETVFALLYGLGLRVGEVARLKLGDVDFSRDILMIRETKFSKSRLVPLGPLIPPIATLKSISEPNKLPWPLVCRRSMLLWNTAQPPDGVKTRICSSGFNLCDGYVPHSSCAAAFNGATLDCWNITPAAT